ncbi:uncharacterized protein [Palaemon carinicauda]|uniref:uncharacterized protein n=1 Tax=Palaemon carinicauda TaxID=392227 RepID=UPI0035B6437E
MERMISLALFLPLVRAQIIFPDDMNTSIASTNPSTSFFPGLELTSVPDDISVDMTRVLPQQDTEHSRPSASVTLLPEMNLTVISNLKPIPSVVPGFFSSQLAEITPTLMPSLVAFSSSSRVFADIEQESLLQSTSTETKRVLSIPGRVDQLVTRITPRPTFVIRTSVPPSDGASEFTRSGTSTKAPHSFVTPKPVGHNPVPTQSNSDGTPFIQSSQTDASVPSAVFNSFVTPTLSVTAASSVFTSSHVLEESDHHGEQYSTDSVQQGTTTTVAVDTSTPAQEVDTQVVISVMENKDEPLNDGVDSNPQPCKTPLGETGNCTQLTYCQPYSQLRDKTNSSIAVNFLRGRVCRILPRSLFFCCPHGDPILPVGF